MNTRPTRLHRRLAAAITVACTLAAVTAPAWAEEQFNPHLHRMAPEQRPFGVPREAPPGHDFDMQRESAPERPFGVPRESPPFHNDPAHFATPRGTVVTSLPREAVFVQHGGVSYSFHNGVWYRPYGPRFVVVAAPIGAFVPVLPLFYTTVWFGGLPYYYADDVYYTWHPEQSSYQVVAPPPGAPEPVVNADRLYAYPLNDQTPDQQARDRYDCHVWATNETGVDPSQNAKGTTATQTTDYDRATTACLSGRGYTVK